MGFIDPEHVKSPLWSPFRRTVIEAQGNRCVLCEQEAPFPYIQPRNIFYTEGRYPWEYDVDEMQVVCRSCYYGALDGTKNVLGCLKQFTPDEQMQLLVGMRDVYNAEGRGSTGAARVFLEFVENRITPLNLDESHLDYLTHRAEMGMLALPRETLALVVQSLTLLRQVSAHQRAQILSEL